VHRGATSQDVLDTAAMLVARRALEALLGDLRSAADAAATLARRHADTPIAGRTLLQQAVPTTFGLKAAGWMVGLDTAVARLAGLRLPAQLGGAAGTLESLGEHGPAVLRAMSARLGLAEPTLPWHTMRLPVAELAGALAQGAIAVGKPAGDVVLLAQTELAEVIPDGGGESSTMPHKRNPVAAVAARAGALQAPGLVATLLTAGIVQEHERAAGGWHAEWRPFTELLRVVGSAAAWLAECLRGLRVDADAMRKDLECTGGLLVSERVSTALTPKLGRLEAHDVVSSAAVQARREGRPLAEVLDADTRVALPREELDKLLDPTRDLHTARALTARALERRGAADG
jgi:3-carboxy-cis,cis-muconate cycloisomerase